MTLSERLTEYADRACDVNHPKGWLTSWTQECVDDVRRAGVLIETLEEDAARERRGTEHDRNKVR